MKEGTRYHGVIVEWNDEKRFGFILPRGSKPGDPVIFLLGSSFVSRNRKPRVGDDVTYRTTPITSNPGSKRLRSKIKAEDVLYATEEMPVRSNLAARSPLVFAAAAFILALGVIAFIHPLGKWALILTSIASAITIISYAYDKHCAKTNARRVPESSLQILALVGGWPGGVFAQQVLRHKTQKASFQRDFKVAIACNVAIWTLGFLALPSDALKGTGL